MTLSNRKKIFHGVMSEFEKKLNRAHLAGYEDIEPTYAAGTTSGLYAPVVASRYPGSVPQANEPMQRSREQLTASIQEISVATRQEQSQEPTRLQELARKNMSDPNILYMRNNTHNKVYGYSPIRSDMFSKPSI
jgi:hypothetical protein